MLPQPVYPVGLPSDDVDRRPAGWVERADPSWGEYSPIKQLKSDVFPAPFGPITANISPLAWLSETSCRLITPPKRSRGTVRQLWCHRPAQGRRTCVPGRRSWHRASVRRACHHSVRGPHAGLGQSELPAPAPGGHDPDWAEDHHNDQDGTGVHERVLLVVAEERVDPQTLGRPATSSSPMAVQNRRRASFPGTGRPRGQ